MPTTSGNSREGLTTTSEIVRHVTRGPASAGRWATSESRTHSTANTAVVDVATGREHEEAQAWRGLTRHATRIPQPAGYDQGGDRYSRGVGSLIKALARYYWAWPAALTHLR